MYNGKELNEDFGLNWYNYGFRMYDPAIGRFPSIDPIADQFAWVSPYNYAENEPIANIDLHGLQKLRFDGMMESRQQQVLDGEVSQEQYFDELKAYGTGGVIGAGIVAGGVAVAVVGTEAAATYVATELVETVIEEVTGVPIITDPGDIIEQGVKRGAKEGVKKSTKSTNKLKPDSDATGDHTSFSRDDNGDIFKYETYEKTKTGHDNPTKRFDGGKPDGSPGKPHNGVPTPHVQGKKIDGGVRKPKPNEIPNNPRFKKE